MIRTMTVDAKMTVTVCLPEQRLSASHQEAVE
jgi:hypothetical protein